MTDQVKNNEIWGFSSIFLVKFMHLLKNKIKSTGSTWSAQSPTVHHRAAYDLPELLTMYIHGFAPSSVKEVSHLTDRAAWKCLLREVRNVPPLNALDTNWKHGFRQTFNSQLLLPHPQFSCTFILGLHHCSCCIGPAMEIQWRWWWFSGQMDMHRTA